MSLRFRRLAEGRPWVLLLLLVGLAIFGSACKSTDSSCNEGDSDYPECLEHTG